MALQNQTAFASAVPSASPTSAYSVSSNLTKLIVLASNDNPDYENNYYEDTTYNAAPPSLSYSVQQAINFGNYIPDYFQTSGEGQYTLRLAADGCRQSHSSTEDVVYDCSISCVSPKDIFTHMPTMANCMAYGLIADALFSSNVSDSFKQTAMKYGISANRTTATQVRSKILSCFNQCKSLEICGFRSGSSDYDSLADASLSLYYQVSDMCSGVIARTVMTDIAGIGVTFLIRSYEQHKLTFSARSISHTGSKAALRSQLLVYSNCTTSGFTTLSSVPSSGVGVS